MRFARRAKSRVLDYRAEVYECAATRTKDREPSLLAFGKRYVFGAPPLVRKDEPATLVIANGAVTVMKMDREIAPAEPVHQVHIVFVKLNTDVVRAI